LLTERNAKVLIEIPIESFWIDWRIRICPVLNDAEPSVWRKRLLYGGKQRHKGIVLGEYMDEPHKEH